jgi:serine/threonine protein kinase
MVPTQIKPALVSPLYYMITEFVSRGSLFEVLHQRKQELDYCRILLIAKQIAMALLYMH